MVREFCPFNFRAALGARKLKGAKIKGSKVCGLFVNADLACNVDCDSVLFILL